MVRLNVPGDLNPLPSGMVVTTTPGFAADAFKQYAEGGWGLQHPADFGGCGPAQHHWRGLYRCSTAPNPEFALCPLLTDGAIEALLTAGSDEPQVHLPGKLVTGEWTGTMNPTEPQYYSDLALVRTRAEPPG